MIRRLSRLSEREQTLAVAIAFLILGYALYMGICQPQVLRLNSSSARLEGQKSLLRLKQQAVAARRVSKEQKDELMQEIGKLDSCFFSKDEADRFIAGLSDLAASVDCRVIQAAFVSEKKLSSGSGEMSPESDEIPVMNDGAEEETIVPPETGLSNLSVRMNLVGRFGGLVELLRKIESHGRKVHVGQMNIEVVAHQRAELNVNFVLTVFTSDEMEGGGK